MYPQDSCKTWSGELPQVCVFQAVTESESLVQQLQQEVLQGNQLRKQQLVELGLLREEEKQKLQRQSETQVNRHIEQNVQLEE